MSLNKLSKQLRLMTLLAGNTTLGLDEVARRLSLSRRSIYRYLEAFRDEGFTVTRSGDIYSLDRSSPFFRKVSGNILLTDSEAAAVLRLIAGKEKHSAVLRSLSDKLARIYDYGILRPDIGDAQLGENISLLYEAIRQHLTAVLCDYHSLRTDSVRSRIVEPYCFMPSLDDVRCFELSSRKNKTFKLARIGKVKLLDLKWSYESLHQSLFTDDFGFTGEPVDEIRLHLSPRAAALMREEMPLSVGAMSTCSDGSVNYCRAVCSYLGPARFIFGLFEDIEVKGSEKFLDFLKEKIRDLTNKYLQ